MKSFAQEVKLEIAGKAVFDVMDHDGPIGTERPKWVTCATTPRQDAARRYANAALAAVSALPQADSQTDDEPEACHVCCEALQLGDPVYYCDDGMMHAACCGAERECFYNEDEAPLVDGEPIPRPLIWNGDLSTMQLASDARNDEVCVDRFANVMKAKLAAARNKGRAGWDDPTRCSLSDLSAMLFEHVAKGDPVDIANFAMMIHQRGGMIEAPSPQADMVSPAGEGARTLLAAEPPLEQRRLVGEMTSTSAAAQTACLPGGLPADIAREQQAHEGSSSVLPSDLSDGVASDATTAPSPAPNLIGAGLRKEPCDRAARHDEDCNSAHETNSSCNHADFSNQHFIDVSFHANDPIVPVAAYSELEFGTQRTSPWQHNTITSDRQTDSQDPSPQPNVTLAITPQIIRDTAAWCQSEDELRETLRLAAMALEAASAPQKRLDEAS